MSKPTQKPQQRKAVDWEAVERDYRTTQLTFNELAERYGTSTSAIGNRVTRYGWVRDLTDAVRQVTQAKIIERTLTAKRKAEEKAKKEAIDAARAERDLVKAQALEEKERIEQEVQAHYAKSKKAAFTKAIEANTQAVLDVADINASVIISHREMLVRLAKAVKTAEAKLAETSFQVDTVKDTAVLIQATNNLASTIKTLIEQERKAYGLDDPQTKQSNTIEDLLAQLDECSPVTSDAEPA